MAFCTQCGSSQNQEWLLYTMIVEATALRKHLAWDNHTFLEGTLKLFFCFIALPIPNHVGLENMSDRLK